MCPAAHRGRWYRSMRDEGRGTFPGDMRPRVNAEHHPSTPLNEGRGTHPGDTARSTRTGYFPSTLNEGRGTHLVGELEDPPNIGVPPTASCCGAGGLVKRTACACAHRRQGASLRSAPASRGFRPCRRGHAPRRQAQDRNVHCMSDERSTKAGARTPATLGGFLRWWWWRNPLNEGRGTHPGDTGAAHAVRGRDDGAQRRPGHAPRRHSVGESCTRSTPSCAQRRPGHAPRRHAVECELCDRLRVAQRRPGHAPRRHARNERNVLPARRPLNEGRGTHPGDTRPERRP